MFRTNGFRAIGFTILLFTGCGQVSNSSQSVSSNRDGEAERGEIDKLLDRYQRLTVEQRNSLAGDQIIMQVEALLKATASQAHPNAESIVREHNSQMVRRALQDPDLMEVTGTEIAPPPRER